MALNHCFGMLDGLEQKAPELGPAHSLLDDIKYNHAYKVERLFLSLFKAC